MTDETQPKTRRAPRRRSKSKPTDPAKLPAAASNPASPAPAAAVTPRLLGAFPIHVRWHDLDAFNHVNNAAFLILLEEARLQWLRGVPGDWFGEHALPVMAAVQLQYQRPITWPAEIDVVLTCQRLGNTSITLGNRVVAHADHACVYAEGNVVMVWTDPATGTAVALPESIRAACTV